MSYSVDLQLIKEKRKKQRYSMRQMAEFLGLKSKADYFKREHGDTRFASTELPILSKVLGIPMKDFFTQDVDKIETLTSRR